MSTTWGRGACPPSACPLVALHEAADVAVGVDADAVRGGLAGEAGHREELARQRDDEAGAGAEADFADGDGEARRAADALGVVAQGEMGLRDAHGETPEAPLREALEVLLRGGHDHDVVRAVDALRDRAELVFVAL